MAQNYLMIATIMQREKTGIYQKVYPTARKTIDDVIL